jgi:hypothetical protein
VKKHKFYKADSLAPSDITPVKEDGRVESTEQESNLVSSELQGVDVEGVHMPILDLDFPCELIPSSSAGHFHFYMYKECTWPQYMAVLTAMAAAGLIEVNYVQASIARRATFVRKPGILKVMEDES